MAAAAPLHPAPLSMRTNDAQATAGHTSPTKHRARLNNPAALIDGWRQTLRTRSPAEQATATAPTRGQQVYVQEQYGAAGTGAGAGYGGGRRVPPSVVSSSNRLSTNPSLLSLDRPASPSTTVDPYGPLSPSSPRYVAPSLPTASLPIPGYRHSTHAPQPGYQPAFSHSSRSHTSLPSYASGSGGRHPFSKPHQHAPHAQQQQHQPARRYDADYDRSLPVSAPSAMSSGGATAGPSRELYDHRSATFPSPTQAPIPPPVPSVPRSSRPLVAHTSDSAPRHRREREVREDGGASSSTARRPTRSKREAVDPADLGRRAGTGSSGSRADAHAKDSKESLESVETDFSGRTRSSGRQRRRRREGDEEGEEETGAGGVAGRSRQLFDPRKDDPMRFTQAAPTPSARTKDMRSFANGSVLSFQSSMSDVMASPVTGSDYTATGGADDGASILTGGSARSRSSQHPALAHIKRLYKEITTLETQLQEENRAAQAAASRDADGEEGKAAGVRIQGQAKRFDDEYWVKLASRHKQLVEAHFEFLKFALDPSHPASFHSLPQRYNIPTRLWQTAFHQLLERMRHAVLAFPFRRDSASSSSANVLEHLIEYCQWAYTFYSQLLDEPLVASMQAAWIEQLGDLARYRMAVAGLASRVHAAQQQAAPSTPASLTAAALDAHEKGEVEDAKPHRPADAASIGQAALNDWDLEEQETWREIAKDWYGQGLAENPGTGRLQHHLALLSKGDELRSLYHYCKSLTAAHPYVSARESILPLFEDEHQARRTQPDVTKAELFVHLHGMLFTKISLDDFDEYLERFVERLKEEGWALNKVKDDLMSMEQDANAPFGDREWFMLGIINVAALLQYGAEDGVLRKLMNRDTSDAPEATGSSRRHGQHASSRHGARSSTKTRLAPQAIMVKRAEEPMQSSAVSDIGDDTERASSNGTAVPSEDVVKQLNVPAPDSPEDDPLLFKLAQRLAFSLLSVALREPFRRLAATTIVNPYVTVVLTFLAHLSFHPAAFKHVERAIPWQQLAELFGRIPPVVEIRLETPAKLVGGKPLPEDWCIRGMDWAGRQLFGRGYWREHRHRSAPEVAGLPPPIEGVEGTTVRVESEMDALKFDLAALDDVTAASTTDDDYAVGQAPPSGDAYRSLATQLAEGRWRRIAVCAAWLVRNIPGFDFDISAMGLEQRFRVTGVLRDKVESWRQEDEDAREAERLSRLALEDKVGSAGSAEEDGDGSDDEEDFEDENDSEEVRDLKARRRQLKAIIRQARSTTRSFGKASLKVKLGGKSASIPKVFPGYTVLVFDTNVLLTSIKLFSELVAAECWTIIVPLAVVTELDGLKRNSTPLGVAANEVIDYLEQAIRGYSRFLKIQTSRGNYLKDLAIRNESIDFRGGAHSSVGDGDLSSSNDIARTMDDVILHAAAWQNDHFTNRVALVNPRAIVEKVKVPSDAVQVVLVTFDRNLRLKARARGIDVTDEKGLKKALDAAGG
ncbi:nucleotide binding protein, PINc domain protein [Rhodotorula toruloides]|uniref:Nucleotide binding protein, PINc domain protein n=1 Tax=Rhodotorula toruloides TaxID=5286 RepID=A0A511KBP4_RHOTO|nr:nucleotide binding protein, PINc domain protein [Rhodotorula toruloides]